MKVLVIGSGGREHAICYAFNKSDKIDELFCADGNAGIAEIAKCIPIKHDEIERLAEFASLNSIDLTFAGGETPLALGVVDEFESRGLRIIGPGKDASQLEASKSFAKDFMARHGVPTAKYVTADSPASCGRRACLPASSAMKTCRSLLKQTDSPPEKASLLRRIVPRPSWRSTKWLELVGAHAAEKIVIEECLFGKEVSLLMFADGEDFALMPPVRDHKRIGEGDTGPNTGGMGTFTDDSLLSDEQLTEIVDSIVRPTLRGCIGEGFRFRGILFLGLMMTANGPKLLEYNVRFGDPETQSILVRLETDLLDICEGMLQGAPGSSDQMAAGKFGLHRTRVQGIPGESKTGDLISGIDDARCVPGTEVFHAGTAMLTPDEYYTAAARPRGDCNWR